MRPVALCRQRCELLSMNQQWSEAEDMCGSVIESDTGLRIYCLTVPCTSRRIDNTELVEIDLAAIVPAIFAALLVFHLWTRIQQPPAHSCAHVFVATVASVLTFSCISVSRQSAIVRNRVHESANQDFGPPLTCASA